MSTVDDTTITIPAMTPEDVAKLPSHDNSNIGPVELNSRQRRRIQQEAANTVAAARASCLSDEDLAEVQAAAENVQRMQQAFADAQQQAEAYLRQARDRVVGAQTVSEYLIQRTRQRYDLGDGEAWGADGTITRVNPET